MTLSQSVRRLVLPLFRHVNLGDITIRHHWTGDALRLHSFKHKGYWWYGRNRERASMNLFAALIARDSQVLEIGGHIGYVAQYYSALVGPLGRVFCFEPSPENLPYLKTNVEQSALRNIEIVQAAAGNRDGSARFFYESITGQNSTAVPNFRGLELNSSFNALPTGYQTCTVPMKKVDSFLAEHQIEVGLTTKDVNFIKIDAEGGERDILLGMTDAMRRHPRLMVEINTNHAEVFGILTAAGYLLFDPSRVAVLSPAPEVFGGNIFAIHLADTAALDIMRDRANHAPPTHQAIE